MTNPLIEWIAYSKRRNINIETFLERYDIKTVEQFSEKCNEMGIMHPSENLIHAAINSKKSKKASVDNTEKIAAKKVSPPKKRNTRRKNTKTNAGARVKK